MTVHVKAEPVMRRPDTPAWLTELAQFCAGLRYEALPEAVVPRTLQVIGDCIAAIAAGAQEPETIALATRVATTDDASGAAIIGAGRRASPSLAAFLNGTAGTMLELDEGNQFCRGHPGIHVVPAVLAAAARLKASGRDVVTAIALGYEIGARIGIASKLRITMHPHGTWGTVGAAVAIAWLERRDAAGMIETINVASSLGLSTSRRTMLEGGTVRNSFAGFSNQIGLMVSDLVVAGFTGEADGLGTVYGTVIADDWRPEEMVAELGERWEIARNYFKRHACCRYNHGALDALAEITRREGRLDPAAIERVDVATYIWAAQLAGQEPHNMLAAKFSLPFSIATTIVHGGATVPAFREPARTDEMIRALARRIFVREDPEATAKLPALRPARVTIMLTDGRVFEAQALTNRGDTEDPYTPAEVRQKFFDLAVPVWGQSRAEAIIAAVDALPQAHDTTALDDLLAAPPAIRT
ncbi:MmgE/PrpD family protein [Bosea sp. (in: a-proteobacteria)]|uniref:MmgE/PrpD family protein n=1 Tax=Bosea sp. (in: a-proteobacteria) TaxID=1871050 RepID=UPI003B3ABBA2